MKKGSWEQATVGLMLFHCDSAGTKIIIIIICLAIIDARAFFAFSFYIVLRVKKLIGKSCWNHDGIVVIAFQWHAFQFRVQLNTMY